MERVASTRSTRPTTSTGSNDSLKRKSGDLDEINDENVNNNNNPVPKVSANSKRLKTSDDASVKSLSSTTGSKVGLSKSSALPRLATRRSVVTGTPAGNSAASAATTAASAPTPSTVVVPTTVSASTVPPTTPRRGRSAATAMQTPANMKAGSSIQLNAMLQETLSELSFSTLREKIEGLFQSNNDRLTSIVNAMKCKTKYDKDKQKKQEVAVKDLKDLVLSTNEDLQGAIEGCREVDRKLSTVLARQITQRLEDMHSMASLREKEKELHQVKESMVEERGEFKNQLLQQRLDYEDRLHRLEANQLSLSSDLAAKEKDILLLENQLAALKHDYETAVKEGSALADQRAESVASRYESDMSSLRESLSNLQTDYKTLLNEKEELLQKYRSLSEDLMKATMSRESSDKISSKQQEDLDRLNAEITQLKNQLNQKDDDLRAAMSSLREMQKQAQEEKTSFWTEFTTLHNKLQAAEEERRGLISQLAEKKEEIALLQRDLSQLTTTKSELEEKLIQQQEEAFSSRDLIVQLEIEKKLRIKCEMHEENERRERTAAVAQLMAVQAESAKRISEIEQHSMEIESQLRNELSLLEENKNSLEDEKKAQSDRIVGLEKEVEQLHKSLSIHNPNNQPLSLSLEEFSRASGEVEVLKRRLKEAQDAAEYQVQTLNKQLADVESKLNVSESQRRRLHNLVQELRGNVRVFARVRPFLPSDSADNSMTSPPEPIITARSELNLLQLPPPPTPLTATSRSHDESPAAGETFTFDKVFGPSTSQDSIFDEVSEFVQSALDGYQVCLFSYGQTGSGKTFTMNGSGKGKMRGIIPRAMEQVSNYRKALEEKGWRFKMEVSFLEIYNETIRDLLRPDEQPSTKHEIKRDLQGNLFVSDLTRITILDTTKERQSEEDEEKILENVMETAGQHRSVCSTLMNDHSSRSHAVFTLHLTAIHSCQGILLNGSLNLVDLAGSERLDRSGVTGQALKETVAINKSLSSLADVFNALAKKQPHIPYRNSKLTHLLQPCLSGDGKTLMIVNLSPTEESYCESLSSLRFASQVNQCELGKPKRRLKDISSCSSGGISAATASTPAPPATPVAANNSNSNNTPSFSSSLQEPLSARKMAVLSSQSNLSASLSKLDELKELVTSSTDGQNAVGKSKSEKVATTAGSSSLLKKKAPLASSTTTSSVAKASSQSLKVRPPLRK